MNREMVRNDSHNKDPQLLLFKLTLLSRPIITDPPGLTLPNIHYNCKSIITVYTIFVKFKAALIRAIFLIVRLDQMIVYNMKGDKTKENYHLTAHLSST